MSRLPKYEKGGGGERSRIKIFCDKKGSAEVCVAGCGPVYRPRRFARRCLTVDLSFLETKKEEIGNFKITHFLKVIVKLNKNLFAIGQF